MNQQQQTVLHAAWGLSGKTVGKTVPTKDVSNQCGIPEAELRPIWGELVNQGQIERVMNHFAVTVAGKREINGIA
jgi:hypothetical protein